MPKAKNEEWVEKAVRFFIYCFSCKKKRITPGWVSNNEMSVAKLVLKCDLMFSRGMNPSQFIAEYVGPSSIYWVCCVSEMGCLDVVAWYTTSIGILERIYFEIIFFYIKKTEFGNTL